MTAALCGAKLGSADANVTPTWPPPDEGTADRSETRESVHAS